jgi:uncharacterized membrane protein YdbT with pleckstrin-like domain
MIHERIIFKGNPSQIPNIGYYLLCIILAPLLGLGVIMFLVRYLETKFTKFEITNERIIQQNGVLSRRTNETELYRVKDIILDEPFFLRIFGLSNVLIVTSDRTSPLILVNAIENGGVIRRELREAVELRRDKKGVREMDFR